MGNGPSIMISMEHENKQLFSIRLEPSRKDRWRCYADESGESLSDWIRRACEDLIQRRNQEQKRLRRRATCSAR